MDLSGWYNQTLSTAPATGMSALGVQAFGATVAIKGRVEFKTQLIRSQRDGTETVSSAQVGTPQAIGIEDRLWLPGENSADATIAHVPLKVAPIVDKIGNTISWIVYLA